MYAFVIIEKLQFGVSKLGFTDMEKTIGYNAQSRIEFTIWILLFSS